MTTQTEALRLAQDPVAFICQGNAYMADDVDEHCREMHTPLYTAPPQPEHRPASQPRRIHPLDIPLDVFVADLSTRPRNIINVEMKYFNHLGDEFIKPPFTVRHLMMFSRSELRKWPNLGNRSLNEIEEMLRNRGLQLWENHDERSLRLLREHPAYFPTAHGIKEQS